MVIVFIILGGLHVPKIHKIVCDTTSAKNRQSSEVIVGSERVDSETEFVILASTGVWEVIYVYILIVHLIFILFSENIHKCLNV